MEYRETIRLKDGRECVLRSGTEADAAAALAVFNLTHEQTDYLLSYPDLDPVTEEQERQYLKSRAESPRQVELLAELDGVLTGLAGISSLGPQHKLRHRAEFGISIDRQYWGLGIGRALLEACIRCARTAGYEQLELSVVADNTRAIALYREAGFVECGRSPKAFKKRDGGYQECVSMLLPL